MNKENSQDIAPSQRLYIFTGKGGVGKTSLAMAFTKFLQTQKRKVYYHSLGQPLNQALAQELELPYFELGPQKSMEEYIAHKLGSQTIARWIFKTPFFSSLFDLLPSLGQLIFLGHILNKIEKDPELTIVLDSPSSGHVLTLFEAGENFKKIFKIGTIIQDIENINQFLYDQNKLKIIILALPSAMAIQEGEELQLALSQLKFPRPTIVLNHVMSQSPYLSNSDPALFPAFLTQKITLENQAMDKLKAQSCPIIFPYSHHQEQALIIQEMASQTKEFL